MGTSHNLNAQFIHKRFGHAFHQQILKMTKIGKYTGLIESILKPTYPCWYCRISNGPRLPRLPNISTEYFDTGTCLHLDFRLFNKVSCQNFTSLLIIVDTITIHLFVYPTIFKLLPLQLIITFIQFSLHRGYKRSIFRIDEGGKFYRPADFMQVCIDHGVIVDITGSYSSSINGKIELPQQTIKNMVMTQLLSHGHHDDLWRFCYKYTIWIIPRPITRFLGTYPVVYW